MGAPALRREDEAQLIEDIASFEYDPLGYVLYAFPWGTGALKGKRPRKWFVDLCGRIRAGLLANDGRDHWEIVQEAVASGHGIGKSAGMSQLILWAMSTMENTRGVVTANTENQLRTKTWPEVIKWHGMAINRHWFECTATSIYHREAEKTWRIDAIPWSAHNTEAFAGLHNLGKRIFLAFDEGSAIADPVWETAEGALTDEHTQIIWLVAGNPTRASGRFRECFTKFKHRWGTANVDARTVEGTNRAQHERWAKDYGENSQFFKIRVKGEFASADSNQLIALEWIFRARERSDIDPAIGDGSRPRLRVSVDCAAGGEDETIATVCKHFDSYTVGLKLQRASFPLESASNDTADLAERLFLQFGGNKLTDDFVVDMLGVGVGAGGELIKRGYNVVMYQGGASSDAPHKWRNRRVQSYMNLRNAFRDNTLVLLDQFLEDPQDWADFDAQLTSIRTAPTERLEDLITKEEMKRQGIKSPDMADSVAMQYATMPPATVPRARHERAPAMETEVTESSVWDGL